MLGECIFTMNPYKDMEESSFAAAPHLTYEDIATKLLKDHFFLSALELHTELVESGKELPQLREFFSNPGNFEQHVSRPAEFVSMQRTPSIATLDSLDTTRYSEDGGGDRGGSGGDVAVLEFELRKARETINSLRANLTQFADGESVLDKNKSPLDQKDLKPHEKKALNFLINEYLLLQDYKLTSITFSDENPDQDFEDWDDVGLNMPHPPGLVSLFRGNSTVKVTNDSTTQTNLGAADTECQTDIDETVCHVSDHDWTHELLLQAEEIELLKQKITALETEKLDFQKLYDAAIISLNSLTTPVLETKGLELIIPEDKFANRLKSDLNNQPLPCNASENHYGSGNSTHSATPELFEMIDNDKSSGITKKESNTSSFDQNSARNSPQKLGSVTTLDETLSINDGGEWTRLQYDYTNVDCDSNKNKNIWIESNIPNSLKAALMSWCTNEISTNEQIGNDLLAELMSGEKPMSMNQLLNLVADTLLRIIPHTLVSRRCEAAALIASTVHLLGTQDGGQRRGKLLQLLMTLLKRPDAAEARIICEATCLIVKWGNSGDVLSSIAELLTSRSTERRVLASQICLSIAPYVSIDLCTSLLLSLVILMCESSENEVRILGLKSACLISAVAEHKYTQLENILFTFIKDPVEKNVQDAVNMFSPVLARAALVAGKLSTDLCARVLTNYTKCSHEKDWKNTLLYLEMLKKLVLAQLAFVSTAQTVRDYATSCDIESMNYQEVCLDNNQENLDIQCYMIDDVNAKSLILAMNLLVKEHPDIRWEELDWMLELMKQILDNAVESKVLNQPSVYTSLINLFDSYIDNFGVNFTCILMKSIFSNMIAELENKLEKLHTVNVECTVVVGIYLVTVLPALDNTEELEQFFQKWIMYSSIRGLPVKLFVVPMKWLADNKPTLLDKYLQSLREFSASSCESASGVSIRVFIGSLLAEFLNICDVSESCVESQLLPAVVALLQDEDVSVRESGISSWGSLTRLSARYRLAVLDKCWSVLDLQPGSLSPREVTRLAEELALLIMPGGGRDALLLDKAVSMVCKVCSSEALGECLSSLTPGLQLAAHHAPRHPLLLPALRKLEELVQAPHLSQHRPTIEALIHNVTGTAPAHEPNVREPTRTGANLNAAEMGRRVTQMFQQSKTNMNLPNIFKKKT